MVRPPLGGNFCLCLTYDDDFISVFVLCVWMSGKEEWKENPVDSDYDYSLIERRLKQLKHMRETEDVWSIIFLLRAGLSRNFAGMGNARLFSHTMVGTKHIIEGTQ